MDDRCPKCNTPKSGDSCPKCGLVFEKFDESVLEEGANPEIRGLWESVLKDWENDSLHAIFVEKALNAGAGGYAAFCYRKRGDGDPKAKAQLEKISKRLEQIMGMTSSPVKPIGGSGRIIATFVLIIVVAILALLALVFYSPGRI